MKKLIRFGLFSFFLLSDFIMFADPGDGGDGGLEGDGDTTPPTSAPINTKLIYLAIAGVLFAVYTFKKRAKKA